MTKKLDFSTVLTENHSYIGELAIPYVLAAFTRNKTIEMPDVRIVDDIVKSAFIAKLSGSNMVQVGYNCSFSDQGTIVASEAELTPTVFTVNLELCYADLEGLWNGLSNGDLNTQEAGNEFFNALSEVVINEMNINFEDAIWNGVYVSGGTGVTQQFNGIDAQITTHVTTETGTTLSASNIVTKVDALIATLPEAVLENPEGLYLIMNAKTRMFYMQALAALGINTPADAQARTYHGFPIYTVNKIKTNRFYLIQPSNIALGLSKADNFTEMTVLDLRQTTGDNKFRIKLQGAADVKVIYESEAAKFVGATV